MMMIITVPKSYVVSGLPLWRNKDDFTPSEPANCFRPTGTAPSFPVISRVPTAWLASSRRGSFLSVQPLGSCFQTTTLQLQLSCFCCFLCCTAWVASIAILLLPFSSWILNSWMVSISCTFLAYIFPAFLLPYLFPYFSSLLFLFVLCLSTSWLSSITCQSVVFPSISYVRTTWLISFTCVSLAFPSISAFLPVRFCVHHLSAFLPPGSPITCKTIVLLASLNPLVCLLNSS